MPVAAAMKPHDADPALAVLVADQWHVWASNNVLFDPVFHAEFVPRVGLGGAGLVMFGIVAATGARILTAVDFKNNRFNLFTSAREIMKPNFGCTICRLR
jgi:hypothetical protein